MSIVRNFNLYLNAGNGSAPYINVNQYDQGEQWVFTLYKEDGTKYTPSTGAIVGIKSDGNAILNSGTVNASGQVVITETQQMTAASGLAVFELLIEGETHGTANFIVNVERRPSDDAEFSDSDLSMLQEAIDSVTEIEDLLGGQDVPTVITPIISDWLDENITNPSNPPIDTSLSVAGAAADAKKVGDEITDLKSALNNYLVNDNDGKQSFYGFGNFQHYGISTSGEFITNQKYRVSNNDPMTFERDLIISVKTGFRWGYIPYSDGTYGAWSGWKTADFKIPKGTSFIVQIARVNEIMSEVADVNEFLNAVTFSTITSVNAEKIREVSFSVDDVKNTLTWEIGGLTPTGTDQNAQPWRLRTKLAVLPFEITIEKSDGYQFRIITFDDASMANPTQSDWYVSNGATAKISSGTYFRLMFLCTAHDSSAYTITDVASSDVFNNAYVYKTDSRLLADRKKIDAIKSYNPCFVSMSHQGYSVTGQAVGYNKVSSYIGSFQHGFDTAETDIQFSSDNVPVCCHDASFTDSVSGSTVVIAEHTAEELKTYNYYGEHIATLDEIMSVCKTYGLRLELDKVMPTWTEIQWNAVFDVVSKYQMQKYVIWTLPYNTNATLNKILAYDKFATVLLNVQNAELINNYITWIRTVITDDCNIVLAILYTSVSVDDVISLNKIITERNIGVMVWTIDDLATYQSYVPYVWGIASNKLCIKDVIF